MHKLWTYHAFVFVLWDLSSKREKSVPTEKYYYRYLNIFPALSFAHILLSYSFYLYLFTSFTCTVVSYVLQSTVFYSTV